MAFGTLPSRTPRPNPGIRRGQRRLQMTQVRQIVTNWPMRIKRQQRVRAPGAAPATLSQQQPPQLSKRTRLQGRGWMQSMAFRIVTTTQRPTTMRRIMHPTHNNSKSHRSRTTWNPCVRWASWRPKKGPCCGIYSRKPKHAKWRRHLQTKLIPPINTRALISRRPRWIRPH